MSDTYLERWRRRQSAAPGERPLQPGLDLTLLVREQRVARLARHGLLIRSAIGYVDMPPSRPY